MSNFRKGAKAITEARSTTKLEAMGGFTGADLADAEEYWRLWEIGPDMNAEEREEWRRLADPIIGLKCKPEAGYIKALAVVKARRFKELIAA